MQSRRNAVKAYFEAQNNSQADRVAALFSDQGEVFNVNLPPVQGKGGIKSFCDNLYARTERREFEVIATAEEGDNAFAEWRVRMKFRAGAKLGLIELGRPFEVELRGVNLFEFVPGSDLIKILRVFHETSTVAKLAQEHAVGTVQ
jgi:limonene-1,2-epoxide hydrolase